MLKRLKKGDVDLILSNLPPTAKVLDIGASISPYKRADAVIDIVPFSEINWSQAKGPGEIRLREENYTEHDICKAEPWPFGDKEFDYSICSHVLEDIRDPIWVCKEMIRTSKAGYVEIPSKKYETTFGLEIKNLAGASHHRWIVELIENKLRFTFKFLHINSRVLNKNKGDFDPNNPEMYLCLEWSDSFDCYENFLDNGKKVFEFLLEREVTEREKWKIYRKLQDRPFITKWLSYLKNTNSFFNKIFKAIKRK